MLTDKTKTVSLDDLISNFEQDDELFSPEDLTKNRKEEQSEELEEEELYDDKEKEESDEQPPQEGDNTLDENNEPDEIPFHKHPRWQKKIEENNELRRKIAELESSRVSPKENVHTPDETLPDWWVEIAGNDDKSARAYNELTKNLTQKAIQEMSLSQMKKVEEEQRFVNTITSNLQTIDDTFGTNLLDESNTAERTDFLNYVEELSPKDENGKITGLPNFQKAFKAWNAEKQIQKEKQEESKPKPNTIIRKQVSDLTKNSSQTPKTEKKSIDVSKMSWSDWRNLN